MLGVAISCVLLLEIPCCIEGNRPENEYGPKSQRFIVHVNFCWACLFFYFVYLCLVWISAIHFAVYFSFNSFDMSRDNLSCLEAVASINFLAKYVLFMCNFFCV